MLHRRHNCYICQRKYCSMAYWCRNALTTLPLFLCCKWDIFLPFVGFIISTLCKTLAIVKSVRRLLPVTLPFCWTSNKELQVCLVTSSGPSFTHWTHFETQNNSKVILATAPVTGTEAEWSEDSEYRGVRWNNTMIVARMWCVDACSSVHFLVVAWMMLFPPTNCWRVVLKKGTKFYPEIKLVRWAVPAVTSKWQQTLRPFHP